ncbi:MAG TPA: transglutaminase domain-containing protein [Acidimicrobiales bacterium]|nr:transglutaminase domain-containing protein [Acidimicrobiales bacterium]
MRATEARRSADATLPATVALAGLTMAVALGMGRLFEGGSYLLPLLAGAAAAHAVMFLGRRLGAPLWLSALAALAAVAVAGFWILLPETTAWGIPAGGTLTAARQALSDAWAEFGDVVAPAPASDGFLLAAMVGLGAAAVLADWAAFRMRVLFEAVVPSFTLFVFTATLGTAGGRSFMVALYLGALLLFLVVHRAELESEGVSWFASRSSGGPSALIKGAAVMAAVAMAAAVVVGPRLPGAAADAVLSWRDGKGESGGRRTTVSPLVDIRSRLVDQSQTEVFAVTSSKRAYWRLTALDTFDGRIWSSDAAYQRVKGGVPAGLETVPTERVDQKFTVRALSSIWLPAAWRPEQVKGIRSVSWNPDLGSLITADETTDGYTYEVASEAPVLTPDVLGGPPAAPPHGDRFVALPQVSPRVRFLAQSLVRNAGTPYQKALAIQDYLRRTGGFRYDLQVPAGHDENALETFLFTTRRGYCEQFAGAYGVLARLAGLPTRVAVGFTPGEPDAEGTYHVKGLNAHAWPEVYLAGAGWVAFEPTPGRGAPGGQAYTGVPEAQAGPNDPSTATTAAPTTTAPDDTGVTPSTTTPPTSVPKDENGGRGRPPWRHPVVAALLGALVAALLLAAAVPVAKGARRRRRRAAAHTAADRVWVAWTEAADALARAGAGRRPAETLDEHARRAVADAALPRDAADALAELAGDASQASYAPGPVPDEAAELAGGRVATIERAVTAAATRRRRAAWLFDPRPLLPSARDDE